MADTTQTAGGALASSALFGDIWRNGLLAAASWLLAAAVTVGFTDVVPWGQTQLFALLLVIGAGAFVVLAFTVHRLGALAASSFTMARGGSRSVSGWPPGRFRPPSSAGCRNRSSRRRRGCCMFT
jgi:hypothetical protein